MYAQHCSQRRRRSRCGLVCERVNGNVDTRRRPETFFLCSMHVCVRACGCCAACGHTLIIITLGKRDGISIYPGPYVAGLRRCRPRNNQYDDVRIQKLNQSPKYRQHRVLILDSTSFLNALN